MSIYWPSVAKGLTVPLTTVMVMGLVPRIELADKGGILALSFIIAGLVYVHDSFVSSQSGRLLSAALSGFDELKRRLEAQGQTLDQIRNIAGDALASHNTMESLLARSAEAVETGLELERRSLDNLNSGLAETQERLRSGLKELQQSLKVVDKTISEGLYVTAEALNGSLLQIHSAFIQAADALAKNHTEAIEQFGKVAETLGSEIGCRFQQALAENRNETERLIQAVADQVQGLGKELTGTALKSLRETSEASLAIFAARLEDSHKRFVHEIESIQKTSGEILKKLPIDLRDLFGLVKGSLDQQADAYARLIEKQGAELRTINKEQEELWRTVLARLTDGSKIG